MVIRVLEYIHWALVIFTMLVLVYQAIIACMSGRKKTAPLGSPRKLNRFAVIISARNEERVIGNIVDSLYEQNYPKDRFDVYVIADNCSDNTSKVAKEHGAIVYLRTDPSKKSKGYALNWFIDRLNAEKPGYYDAIAIFDADNTADSQFLSVMNKHLCQGKRILQGYRDTSNPSETWITGGYTLYLWYMSRFYQRARNTLGLSGIVSGTGFVFTSDLVADGWNTQTITEDTEFSIQQLLKGNRVEFAEDAVFYDEQPTTFIQSWHQRYRWSLGSVQCCGMFLPKLLSAVFKPGGIRAFDMIFFLMAAPCSAIFFGNTILGFIIQILKRQSIFALLYTDILFLAISILLMYVFGVIVIICVKKSIKSVWRGLLLWPVFMFSWTFISLVACFYKNFAWKPVAHRGVVRPKVELALNPDMDPGAPPYAS